MSPAPAGRTDSAPPIADPNGADGTPPPPPPPSDAALTATSPDSAAASRPADVSCAAVSAGRPPPGDPVGGTIGAAGIPVPGVTPEPSDGGIRKPGINPCSCGGGGGSILMAGRLRRVYRFQGCLVVVFGQHLLRPLLILRVHRENLVAGRRVFRVKPFEPDYVFISRMFPPSPHVQLRVYIEPAWPSQRSIWPCGVSIAVVDRAKPRKR